MPLERRDITRLTDMLHYAKKATQILAGRPLAELLADETCSLAIVRCVEVIGEAGHQVSAPVQAALPSVPWHLMWGMRNRLIHDYGNTDYLIVYRVISEELPNLIATIDAFLARSAH